MAKAEELTSAAYHERIHSFEKLPTEEESFQTWRKQREAARRQHEKELRRDLDQLFPGISATEKQIQREQRQSAKNQAARAKRKAQQRHDETYGMEAITRRFKEQQRVEREAQRKQAERAQYVSSSVLRCTLPTLEQAYLQQSSGNSSGNRSNDSLPWLQLSGAGADTPIQVRVSNDGGVQTSVNPLTYTYLEPPAVHSVAPSSAKARRHTRLNITGSNFYDAPDSLLCDFKDGLLRSNATFISRSQLQCTTPLLNTGLASVRVSLDGGNSWVGNVSFQSTPVQSNGFDDMPQMQLSVETPQQS